MLNPHLQRTFAILLSSLFLPMLASSAGARPVKVWSFSELNAKADLVVVATALSTTDTRNWVYPNPEDTTWVTVDTVFNIETILKGEFKGPRLSVQHFRYWKAGAEITVIDGPSFIEFSPAKKNRYLIFLERKANGLYVPLTGSFDPDRSFFRLENYHITQERGTGQANPK